MLAQFNFSNASRFRSLHQNTNCDLDRHRITRITTPCEQNSTTSILYHANLVLQGFTFLLKCFKKTYNIGESMFWKVELRWVLKILQTMKITKLKIKLTKVKFQHSL